jgi:hypothetical protein
MRLVKRIALIAAMTAGLYGASAADADAAVYVRRFAPVRHVAARAVLPPYPVARRAVVGPVYRPYYYRPAPIVYGPGVAVWW